MTQQLTKDRVIDRRNLRNILILAAARYTTLSLRISQLQDSSWNYTTELIRYFPRISFRYECLRMIIRGYKKYRKENTDIVGFFF
uniref:Uncharacterized protein n=1 Tax=Lepeophtheirus salmonis TaxID=72036 RepID=A0A0K2V818_LEPSM